MYAGGVQGIPQTMGQSGDSRTYFRQAVRGNARADQLVQLLLQNVLKGFPP